MSRNLHFVVVVREDGTWYADNDTADAVFPDGLVYDEDTGEWSQLHHDLDDAERDGRMSKILDEALTKLNEAAVSESDDGGGRRPYGLQTRKRTRKMKKRKGGTRA